MYVAELRLLTLAFLLLVWGCYKIFKWQRRSFQIVWIKSLFFFLQGNKVQNKPTLATEMASISEPLWCTSVAKIRLALHSRSVFLTCWYMLMVMAGPRAIVFTKSKSKDYLALSERIKPGKTDEIESSPFSIMLTSMKVHQPREW